MPVSEETYKRVVLEDTDGVWEWVCGRLREKPPMATEHNEIPRKATRQLLRQTHEREYSVGGDVRLRVSDGNWYVPDLCVVPREYVRRLRERPGTFEVYDDPMPLVIEVWSPSTGAYDARTKLGGYRSRGDLEIWFIHPYKRTLTMWRLGPDGEYSETLVRGGIVELAALPGVTLDFDALFEEL